VCTQPFWSLGLLGRPVDFGAIDPVSVCLEYWLMVSHVVVWLLLLWERMLRDRYVDLEEQPAVRPPSLRGCTPVRPDTSSQKSKGLQFMPLLVLRRRGLFVAGNLMS
jgi:hypothetical protein